MSLVFYDTETTGILPFFDQILQFAAIKTDPELNELDRFEKRCRLSPHIIPSPGALRVNRVSVSRLTDPALPTHYQMVRAVRSKLSSWSPSLFLGWNSIRFDEEIIRQAFYKTLHNPYLTNTKKNSRSDVMRMAQACTLYAPDALRFATGDSNRLVFKLEALAQVNGFSSGTAHEAVRDVEAAIFIAKLIMENAPRVWSNFMRFSKKAAVVDFIEEESIFCLHNFYSGQLFSCFATKIGQNSLNPAEWYAYDLECDPETLAAFSNEELLSRLDTHPKPIRILRSNAAPVLFSTEDAADVGLNPAAGMGILERRQAFIRENEEFTERIFKTFESAKIHYEPSPHVEMQIYSAFADETDEELMERFHAADWSKRHTIVEQFQDPRLKTLGRRLIHLEEPGVLDAALRREHDLAVAHRLLGLGGNEEWMTLPKALQEMGILIADSLAPERDFLMEHMQQLQNRHEAIQGLLSNRSQ